MDDSDIVMTFPGPVRAYTHPKNVKQEDYLLNMTEMTRSDRDLLITILDHYVTEEED